MKTTQNTQSLNFETFFRSNQDTCLSQRPLIKQGQWVSKGQLLADCINSVSGDLALGKNILVAYMPWEGFNFEDSIVISDRLIADDVYTSIHILRFRTEVVNNLSASTNNNKTILDSSTYRVCMPYLQSTSVFSHAKQPCLTCKASKTHQRFDCLLAYPKGKQAYMQSKQGYKSCYAQICKQAKQVGYARHGLLLRSKKQARPCEIYLQGQAQQIGVKEGLDTNKKSYVKPSLLGDLFSQSRLDELRLGLPSVWSSASLSYVPQGLLSSQFSQSSNKHTSPINNNLEQNTHILKTNLRQKVVKATPSKPYFATKTSLSLAPNLFLPKIQRYEFYPKFANLIKFNTFQFNEVVYNALAKHAYKSVRSKICNPTCFVEQPCAYGCLPFLQSMYASKQSNLAKQVRYAKRSIASKQPLQTNQRFSKYDKAKKLKGNPLISKKLQTKAASVKKASAPKAQRRLNENRHANNVETRTPNIPFLGNHLLSHLDQNGIAKVGTWVSPGDILVGKVRPLANKLKSNRASTQLAWEIISNKKNESINVEDKSFRLPKGISGRVIRTEILPHSSSEQIHIYLAVKRKVQVGDKLAGRHGNKGIVSLVLPRQDMPYIADGTPIDIILSPLGVPSRMNVGQIYECLLGLAAKSLACDFKIDNSMASLGYSALKSKIHVLQNKRPYANYAKKTTFFGSETKNFTLTNEGNESLVDHAKLLRSNKKTSACKKIHRKVIQARINTDLCFFNWIKVSNTSCIYSTYTKHLTTLSTRLKNNNNNRKLGITNKQIKDQDSYYIGTRLIKGSTAILSRATLNLNLKTAVNLIPNTSKTTLIKFKQNKQLISYSNLQARNLVFLKLYHSRITCNKKWLFSLTNPGKMKIFDGRTGQPFSSWVTVGYAYMLKLIHLVDNKIHSRSTGPYSLITRQPVTGKARQGGQRIGEMEAWALEGFGAAYTLQEFFSFKGDDVSSRHQWQITSLSKLVGNTTAFKTFLSELRALCISLEFTGFTEGA